MRNVLLSGLIKIVFLLNNIFLVTIFPQEHHSAGPIPFVQTKHEYAFNDGLNLFSGTAYGHSTNQNKFVFLSVPGGTPLILIGSMSYPSFASSGTFGPGGIFYLTTVTSGLFTVNLATGSGTHIAPLSVSNLNGISYDPVSGEFYAVDAANLYKVNVSNGNVTLVGSMGIPGSLFIDIAINCAGEAFTYSLSNDNAYKINLTNGETTLLGPIGFDANYGQGMAFDKQDGTLYLMAFNNTAFSMQLRTMDLITGATTLVTDYGIDQIAPFDVNNTCGTQPGPGPATNPNPINGQAEVSVALPQLTWQNPAGATTNQTYFGTSPVSMNLVQSGSLASSYNSLVLAYSTTYFWRVDETDSIGTTTGHVWAFTTEPNPTLWGLFYDDFENGLGKWVITNDGGDCVWRTFSPPYPNAYTLPAWSQGNVFAADADECGSNTMLLSAATIKNPMNTIGHFNIILEFDSDWNALAFGDSGFVELSSDSVNWTRILVLDSADVRSRHYMFSISGFGNLPQVWLRFKSVQPGWHWWWVIDNVIVEGNLPWPVELVSFTAHSINHDVLLNWSTSTEKNNHGFEIQRRNQPHNSYQGGEELNWSEVGFVDGYGTTTEAKNYSFIDSKVPAGKQIYRLKQIDFDGAFEYSNEVEVDVAVPKAFSLEQNYPNPFNPSTIIKYNLPVDAKVTLKVFDVLGQEVVTLLNSSITSGTHEVTFDAGNLNSGVYFYTIDASGVDGKNFTSTKKMMIVK